MGEGANTLKFRASNAYGITEEVGIVVVMSGALSVIGQPLTFPAPFSPTKDGKVTIQYTLSDDGDIDIILVSGAKQVIKKIVCFAGQEGGAAGVNKVEWDGKMDNGGIVGNGIYTGAIIARSEGRVLNAKYMIKMSVVD